MENSCNCQKTRVRSEDELKKLYNRLSRIEGQVRGLREMLQKEYARLKTMVEDGAPYVDG